MLIVSSNSAEFQIKSDQESLLLNNTPIQHMHFCTDHLSNIKFSRHQTTKSTQELLGKWS